jgi:hypothetical protein
MGQGKKCISASGGRPTRISIKVRKDLEQGQLKTAPCLRLQTVDANGRNLKANRTLVKTFSDEPIKITYQQDNSGVDYNGTFLQGDVEWNTRCQGIPGELRIKKRYRLW